MSAEPNPDLSKIRGWLLVCIVVLVPHGVGPFVALLTFDREALGGTLATVTLVVTGSGNLLGIALILSRNRLAPLFFTVYPPTLLLLTLLIPDLPAIVNARMAADLVDRRRLA